MTIKLLPAQANLSESIQQNHSFSLLSYNILIPNHPNAWWVFKYYPQTTPIQQRQWPARQSLLIDQLLATSSDIICLQEVDATHFQSDFQGLNDQYQGVMHTKGKLMRCATFWKPTRLHLIDTINAYRCLMTLFQTTVPDDTQEASAQSLILVINVHLSGGPKPEMRIQQIHNVLKKADKIFKTRQIEPQHAQIILCGDFNTVLHNHSLAVLLSKGLITPHDRDLKYPHVVLSKKDKKQNFTQWIDAYHHVYGNRRLQEAPSILSRDFIAYFCEVPSPMPTLPTELESIDHTRITESERLYMYIMHARTKVYTQGMSALLPWFKKSFLNALYMMFHRFASLDEDGKHLMGFDELNHWINTIHPNIQSLQEPLQPKGSEYHKMLAYLQGQNVLDIIQYSHISKTNPQESELSIKRSLDFETWRDLYLSELLHGKWWSIAHDLTMCELAHLVIPTSSEAVLTRRPLYQTCLDHILLHHLQLEAVRATIDPKQLQDACKIERSIPNDQHPSDHFPLAVIFTCAPAP